MGNFCFGSDTANAALGADSTASGASTDLAMSAARGIVAAGAAYAIERAIAKGAGKRASVKARRGEMEITIEGDEDDDEDTKPSKSEISEGEILLKVAKELKEVVKDLKDTVRDLREGPPATPISLTVNMTKDGQVSTPTPAPVLLPTPTSAVSISEKKGNPEVYNHVPDAIETGALDVIKGYFNAYFERKFGPIPPEILTRAIEKARSGNYTVIKDYLLDQKRRLAYTS
jgi:hypothetical protein